MDYISYRTENTSNIHNEKFAPYRIKNSVQFENFVYGIVSSIRIAVKISIVRTHYEIENIASCN